MAFRSPAATATSGLGARVSTRIRQRLSDPRPTSRARCARARAAEALRLGCRRHEGGPPPLGDEDLLASGRDLVEHRRRNHRDPQPPGGRVFAVEAQPGGRDAYGPNPRGRKVSAVGGEIVYVPRTGSSEGDIILGDELAAGGEAAVNAANGNLLLTSPDVNYQGEGYETRLSRYYNSEDENLTASSLGAGWLLSTGNSTLLNPAWWDHSYSLHEPGGGVTRFDPTPPASSNENQANLTYKATPGLDATLVAHADGTRAVTFNETGNEWQFNNSEAGYPQKIIEPAGVGNTISLGYTESRLTHLSDTHGHELTITLDPSTHHVTKIQNSNGEHWEYGYNASHQLVSYKDSEGHETKYAYTSTSTSGLVNTVTDTSGTYVITYDSIVNGTVKEAGSEDEITSYEYRAPESPTCNPATDVRETVVTYAPDNVGETYCFDANDHFTGPKTADQEEQEEHTATPEEIAAGTCTEAEVFKDCELEESPPETIEDLPPHEYGIADNNWIQAHPLGKKEEEKKETTPVFFPYFEKKPFQELQVQRVRRTIPWNMALEAKYDDEKPETNHGAKIRREDVETWIKEVKALDGGKGEPVISFERCPKGTEWEDPTVPASEDAKDDKSCEEPPSFGPTDGR